MVAGRGILRRGIKWISIYATEVGTRAAYASRASESRERKYFLNVMARNIYQFGRPDNTGEALYLLGITRHKDHMLKSIDDIRRDNLRYLLNTLFSGKQAALADALGKQANIVSRVLGSGRADPRNIGTEWAREIEKQLGLAANWLDNNHAPASATDHAGTSDQVAAIINDLARMAATTQLIDRDFELLRTTAWHIAQARQANRADSADPVAESIDSQAVLDKARGKGKTTAPPDTGTAD